MTQDDAANSAARLCSLSVSAWERKYHEDIGSIRAAMELAIREFDAHSKIADPIDEARLEGMRALMSCFNAEAASCRHL